MSPSDSEVYSFSILHGTYEDLPETLELGDAFHKEADLDFFCPVDLPSFGKFVESILNEELNGIYLVAKKDNQVIGICIGLLVPVYFNHSQILSQEIVFYVEQGSRDLGAGKKLLEAFELESIRKGANIVCVGAKSNMRVESMGRMYQKRGYTELERYHVRRI